MEDDGYATRQRQQKRGSGLNNLKNVLQGVKFRRNNQNQLNVTTLSRPQMVDTSFASIVQSTNQVNQLY
jgi:hypothetical protein